MTESSPPLATEGASRRSPRAEQILEAAERLIVKQGFKGVTMATVAQRAHVGKGTAYQYWHTKEDLFLELFSKELAGLLMDLAARVRAEPMLARPEELCPAVVRSTMANPLGWALQTADDDLLGALLDDPRIQTLIGEHGAEPLLRALAPVWQQHGVTSSDRSADEQARAMDMLVLGYVSQVSRTPGPPGMPRPDAARVIEIERTLRWALAALSGASTTPEDAGNGTVSLAGAVADVLEEHASQVIEVGR